MRTNRLIERAEVYEGVARGLRKALALRKQPDAQLTERALEAESRAAQLRTVAKTLRGK